jgi:phosphatidylserine/phosphatidylglycerophosphate/cardiolipin synthase-like enzyme
VTACLTPGGNCTDASIHALSDATHTILVQADAFTSAPMAKARLDTHTGGVQVQVILDTRQRTERYASADFLANQGVPIMIDAEDVISHHKVMMIDGEMIITGRFNFTKAAQEQTADNVLSIRGPTLAAQETQLWDAHQRHRQPSVGRGVRESWWRERRQRGDPTTGDRLRSSIGATAMTLKRRQGRGLPVADAPDEGGPDSESGKSLKPPDGCAAISL